MRDLRNHPNKKKREEWDRSSGNEYGRLMKDIGKKWEGKSRVQGCDTFHFIKKNQIPKGKKVTYARFCCDVRPQKEEKNRTRMTAGGDRLEYDGETTTETSTIETAKILINSTISTDNDRFVCWEIGNFYTNSRLQSQIGIRCDTPRIDFYVRYCTATEFCTSKVRRFYLKLSALTTTQI